MQRLGNVTRWYLSLDLTDTHVAWAMIDGEGELMRQGRGLTWGVRRFEPAQGASEARMKRAARRRINRTRRRLLDLQWIFAEEVSRVDDAFYRKLSNSGNLIAEGGFEKPLYFVLRKALGLSKEEMHRKFPTMYHLRVYLMTCDERPDIRVVYTAFHHILKNRGNFLYGTEPFCAAGFSAEGVFDEFSEAFCAWCDEKGYVGSCDTGALLEVLLHGDMGLADRKKRAAEALCFADAGKRINAELGKIGKVIGGALAGGKVDFAPLLESESAVSASLFDDGKAEELIAMADGATAELIGSMYKICQARMLVDLLKDGEGTVSERQVGVYERYKSDLRKLKRTVRRCVPEGYAAMFAGWRKSGSLRGIYTAYADRRDKTPYDEFAKEVLRFFEDVPEGADAELDEIRTALSEGAFLVKPRGVRNRSIPHQFHLEEMNALIANLSKWYPFLEEERDKLTALLTFRIPYYVGPVARNVESLDKKGRSRFSWAKRKPGMERTVMHAWNFDDIVDKPATMEEFMRRLVGQCTFLIGETVLPRNSLLYEEFCVLNELNAAWVEEGGDKRRLNLGERTGIYVDLFMSTDGAVTYDRVEKWFRRETGRAVRVGGGAGEKAFANRLSAGRWLATNVFGSWDEVEDNRELCEELVRLSTSYEDRGLLREVLFCRYGDRLSKKQIDAVCAKRLTGWGKLSRRFLEGIRASDAGKVSVIDVLRYGVETTKGYRTVNLPQLLSDPSLGFGREIEKANARNAREAGLDDIACPAAVRRAVNQAMRVVAELVDYAGCAPEAVFVTNTRSDKPSVNVSSRAKTAKAAVSVLVSKGLAPAELKEEVKAVKAADFRDDKLFLYFMQGGKSLYSETRLDLGKIDRYELSHIVPRFWSQDDSSDNLALVLPEEVSLKSDSLMVSPAVVKAMYRRWEGLRDSKAISQRKFANLVASDVSSKRAAGYINRQINARGWMVKTASALLQAQLPDTKTIGIKQAMVDGVRDALDYPKHFSEGDYGAAHDAYIAAQFGRFLSTEFPDIHDNPIGYAARVKAAAKGYAQRLRVDARKASDMPSAFLVSAFVRGKGEWDGELEAKRIGRTLNYKPCFFTWAPFVQHGQFWDETVYSPSSSRAHIPLKKGKDVDVYGGYNSCQNAYTCIYSYCKQDDEGKKVLRYANVPVNVYLDIVNGRTRLEDYISGQLRSEGRDLSAEDVRIVRAKIPKNSYFSVNGELLVNRGARFVRNAERLWFSVEEVRRLARWQRGAMNQAEQLELFGHVARRCADLWPGAKVNRDLEGVLPGLDGYGYGEVEAALRSLLVFIAGGKADFDLSSVGGSKWAGKRSITHESLLNDKDVDYEIVDTSVAGFRVKRTRVE